MRNQQIKPYKRKLKVLVGFKEGEDMNEPVYHTEEVNLNYIKMYEETLFAICKINTLASNLMLYIVIRMNPENIIINDSNFKDDFIKAMAEKDVNYSKYSIDREFSNLVTATFLERKSKGCYQVNSKYFWKDTERERIKRIKMELEFNNKEVKINIQKELEDGL